MTIKVGIAFVGFVFGWILGGFFAVCVCLTALNFHGDWPFFLATAVMLTVLFGVLAWTNFSPGDY